MDPPWYAADDLVAGNAGIHSGHYVVPFVAHLVQVGVADAAEEDLDLDVVGSGSRRAIVEEASGDVALAAEYALALGMKSPQTFG